MNNHIVKKITFNKPYWFNHDGNNPNAIVKIEKLKEKKEFWSFDANGNILTKFKKL